MSFLLPHDDNGQPIGIMGFVANGTQKLTVGAAGVRSQRLADNVHVVSLYATAACRFEVGGITVSADAATSPFVAPGYYLDLPVDKDERYVAFVAESGDCSAYVIGRT